MKKLLLISLMILPLFTSPVGAADADGDLAMTEAEALEFCAKWLPNWVGGEPSVEKLLTFYTDNTFYEDPNVPQGLRGKAELGGFLRILLKKYPDWKFDIVSVYPTKKGFILQYLGTVPVENGKVIKNFRGVDIIELENGKISRQLGYYDRHVFFE